VVFPYTLLTKKCCQGAWSQSRIRRYRNHYDVLPFPDQKILVCFRSSDHIKRAKKGGSNPRAGLISEQSWSQLNSTPLFSFCVLNMRFISLFIYFTISTLLNHMVVAVPVPNPGPPDSNGIRSESPLLPDPPRRPTAKEVRQDTINHHFQEAVVGEASRSKRFRVESRSPSPSPSPSPFDLETELHEAFGRSRSKGSGSKGLGSKGSGSKGWGSKGLGSKGSGSKGWGSKGSGSKGSGSKGSGSKGSSKGSGSKGSGSTACIISWKSKFLAHIRWPCSPQPNDRDKMKAEHWSTTTPGLALRMSEDLSSGILHNILGLV